MKRFYVVANVERDPGLKTVHVIESYLIEHGATCHSVGIERHYDDPEKETEILSVVEDDTECVITLGGDGTFIQVARILSGRSIPMIGVNMGHLGYLTEVSKDDIEETLNKLLADNYDMENRMMLRGIVRGQNISPQMLPALNDIVIARYGSVHSIDYNIYVNGKHIITYAADGIIVSTPTGSTGYNMSVGGPIVEPCAKLILIAPIAAHTLNTRAVVLSYEDRIRVEIATPRSVYNPPKVEVCFDGSKRFAVGSGDYVDITCADEIAHVIKTSKEGFLDVLSRKISS